MIPVEQRTRFDCLTACLASLFECRYEDAPILCDQETGESADQWLRTMYRWADERGVSFWHFGLWGDERPFLMFGGSQIEYHFEPPGYWLAAVTSPRYDGEHAVVMHGQELVWDPHPQRDMGHLGFVGAEVPIFAPVLTIYEQNVSPGAAA